ncbi:hypothetical protein F5146DRAFT_1007641 [Armillaria mellea]|nr:hypothetical protein F5146DRAFT_1007641 [Armillaria mellea]
MYIPTGSNTTKNKPQPLLSIYKLYQPDNSKTVQLLLYHDVCLYEKGPFPMTVNSYPDYKSIPWKCLSPSLYEWNLMLTSWPASVPLSVTDKADSNFLSKSTSSLMDSQKGCLTQALEDEELKIIPGHMMIPYKPLVEGHSKSEDSEYIFVCTNPDTVTNTFYEGVYSTATELSHHWEKRVAFEDPEANDNGDNFQPKDQKLKKTRRHGGKRQRHMSHVPSSMENVADATAIQVATTHNNASTSAAPSQVANSKQAYGRQATMLLDIGPTMSAPYINHQVIQGSEILDSLQEHPGNVASRIIGNHRYSFQDDQNAAYYKEEIDGSAGGGIYDDPGWNNSFNTGSDLGGQWE